MSEWFKELVLKTSDVARHRGFESHPLRHIWSGTQEAEEDGLLNRCLAEASHISVKVVVVLEFGCPQVVHRLEREKESMQYIMKETGTF